MSASPGLAKGEAFLIKRAEPLVIEKKAITDPKAEIIRFHSALEIVKIEISQVKAQMSKRLSENELEIYDAHISILEDPELSEKTSTLISTQNCCADFALHSVANEYMQLLLQLDDEYLRARAKDIKEVSNAVIKALQGKIDTVLKFEKPIILVAHTISTHLISTLDVRFVMGVVTAQGGATDHSSILYNAMGIPALVGVGKELECVQDATSILLDAENGFVKIAPDEKAVQAFEEQYEMRLSIEKRNLEKSHLPAKTLAGKQLKVYANIGSVKEAREARSSGADGVGLLRTEFCFLERNSLPTEEEQYEMYKAMLDELPNMTVVIRLIDIGSDKKVSYIKMEEEENPALGVRALRLGFQQYETLLKPQIRALLRLSASYSIQLLFPMIATPKDLQQIKEAVHEEMNSLEVAGTIVDKSIPMGIMVEVPNVALLPELFVDEVDFFSFGTNDLAQYMMAADRTSASVSEYIPEAIPGIVRLIENVVQVAHEKGKWVGICGGLAADTNLTETFIGMGVDELSMPSTLIPKMKAFIRLLN
ncbi:phosphoenolpyruvate--protein phosphotransferase [Maribacter sp.]|nr:phosphoenolpyruvate--protein phosphotransferase [Maribacter sp.]